MAAFTSVQTGDWNDGATWGKTSPGDKGTDWPGLAGDTATIGTGHVVTYNVSETNELGAVTVNGTLVFSRAMSTKLAIGNASINIGATGKIDWGTDASPIPSTYFCEVSVNTTSDDTNGIIVANGGLYTICGASDYCTNYESTIANDAENTDDDATIILNDDRSADWHVGDEITIQREWMGDASSHTDAIIKRTIQSMTGTTVVLTETVTGMVAGVGDTWVSTVTNVTRNVRIYKKDAVTDIQSGSRYNTNRPKFTDGTIGANSNYIKNAQITGFYGIKIQGGTFINCIVRNGDRAFHNLYLRSNNNVVINSNIYAINYGFYACGNNVVTDSNIYACNYIFNACGNNMITGSNIYACYRGFYSNSINNVVINSNIYACYYAFDGSNNNNVVTSKIGYTQDDVSSPNTYDIRASSLICLNTKMPASGLVINDRNTIGGSSEVMSEHHNKVLNSHIIYRNMGDIIKTLCDGEGTSPSVDPDSGNSYCLEVSNLQSNLSNFDCIKVFLPYRNQIYAQASVEKTYTFKIQSTFTATLTNTEVILEATYLSSAIDGATTTIASVQTVAARSSVSDWSQVLSVTITPAQTGFIDFQIRLCKYESGKKLYIWPEVAIT